MTLQDRILAALLNRTVTPRALYAEVRPEPAHAVDFAVRSLVKSGRIVRRCGHFGRADKALIIEARVPQRPPRLPAEPGAELTHREEEIAELTAAGRTAAELSELLKITRKTVHGHLSNIYAKLEVKGKAELKERMRARAVA